MEEIKESEFFIELINDTSLIITIPHIFELTDLEDMKIKDNFFNFKFNKEISNKNGKNNIAKIQIKNEMAQFLNAYNKNKNNKNIFIIDIKELKRQTKGIFYIYE
jgi:SepF-like predicted cell division protein (DUF552 family)